MDKELQNDVTDFLTRIENEIKKAGTKERLKMDEEATQ